jgi:hypothetical protein
VIHFTGYSVKLAFANVSKRPVFRKSVMKTPIVTSANYADLVAYLTHEISLITYFLRIRLIAIITKEVEPTAAIPVI